MRIGLTYNLKSELSPEAILDSEYIEEFDNAHTVDAICDVFRKNGYETVKLGSGIEVVELAKKKHIDFVFNIAEGKNGRNRESHTPSVLEILNIPYSGSDPLTLALTLDKTMSKKILLNAGIPTPRYKIIRKIEDASSIEKKLYPLLVKPAWEGSSKGIYNSSKVFDEPELRKSVSLLAEKYPDEPVLAEEYIEGREITAGVIGNGPPEILGVMEIVNKLRPGEDFFYSLEVKRDWKKRVDYILPEDIGTALFRQIKHYALLAFREFGVRDIARIDFRVSREGKIFLLEVNPLPGLSPEYADLVIMAKKHGIEYEGLVMSILNHALSRYKLKLKDNVNADSRKSNADGRSCHCEEE